MAWTQHGHQIPESPVESPEPNLVAKCGGTRMCRVCMQDAANWDTTMRKELIVTEHTILKVFIVLKKLGLSDELVLDAINEMQNQGILFRER